MFSNNSTNRNGLEMRQFNLVLSVFLLSTTVHAAPPSRAFNYVSRTTIDPAQNNENENALYSYLQAGVDTYAPGSIDNTAVSSIAAIAYTKLNLLGGITNADVNSSAAIAYSKLNLAGGIVNADINASAAIVDTKLATISTAGKVSGAALTSLASIPVGAGIIPSANLTAPTFSSVAGSYASGTYKILGPTATASTASISYAKVIEVVVPRGGTLSTTFTLAGSSNDAVGRIYRNGVAVGTEQIAVSGTATTYSEDISGWSANDLLQIYANNNNTGSTTYAGALFLYENVPVTQVPVSSSQGPDIYKGPDVPTVTIGTTVGNIGDMYVNTGGGASTTLYVKTGASTWTAK